MKHFLAAALAVTILLIPALASAQSAQWRAIAEEAQAVVVPFERDFEIANGAQLPFYFTTSLPLLEDRITLQTRPVANGNLFEARVLDDTGALLEFLTISDGTIAQGPPEGRMQSVYNVIVQFVYPSIGFPADAEVLGGREAQVGGLAAVEFMARTTGGEYDPIAARIVGVIAPDGVNVVFFVQQTITNRMEILAPDDLGKTYLGRAADAVVFTAYRDAAGAMVAY